MLTAPGVLFSDVPGEIELTPSHVSGPLSLNTREATSVPGISDLFPDLRQYLLFSDEGNALID
jgi:hypothetical protein